MNIILYEHLSPSLFCITNSNYFRCLPESEMEQPCLEACIAYRDKKKKGVGTFSDSFRVSGLDVCTSKALEDLP